jgi:ABC-2 type transport system permease protein
VALKFRTQQAAPLMQMGNFIASLFTTSYAPKALLAGWLAFIATYNPVTYVLAGVRQGFVSEVEWTTTWHAFAAVTGLLLVLAMFAMRGMNRVGTRE